MRTFLILLVLAGAGAGIWWWKAAPKTPGAEQQPVIDGPPQISGPPSLAPPSTDPPAEAKAFIAEADQLWAAAGDHPATSAQAPKIALLYSKALQALYNKPGQKPNELRIVDERLTPLGNALFFSKARYPEDETGTFGLHVVQAGDVPDKIARSYGMSYGLLNRLRGADPNNSNLQIGETVKVVKIKEKGGFFIHVDKSDYKLDVYVAGIFARRYDCSHGAVESPTPVGRTTITKRELSPKEWKDPKSGEIIQSSDPRFILGPVWMAFDNATFPRPGIGIHGYTGENGGMGRQVSNGCVRMLNDQVIELFHTLASPDRAPTSVEVVE